MTQQETEAATARAGPQHAQERTEERHSLLGPLWADRQHLAVGVVAAALVFILRHEGLLVGYWAVALAAVCFVLSPGPRQLSDRLLLAFALIVGFLPLIAWVPGLELKIDVPGVFLAIAVGFVSWHQLRESHAGWLSRTVSLPTPAEAIALLAGAGVTLWWRQPFTRLSPSGTLQALFPGWDNDSHFEMFAQNLKLGSFIQVRPNLPNGEKLLGYDYPQGMHQAWAQYARLLTPRPTLTLPWLLHSYLNVLLLTTGAIVVLGCMGACRLARRDLLAALPVMAIVLAMFAFGRYGPFTGYPNFDLAIVAAAVAVSLMIRPTLYPTTNFFAVAGMGLIVMYNWYPLVLLIAPALALAALRARSGATGRRRTLVSAFVLATAVAYVLPVLFTLHRGTSSLNSNGGLPSNPAWGLLILVLAALVGVAVFRQASHPDLMTNVIIGAPAALGGTLIIALATYTTVSTGSVSYYGEKAAEGFLGVCLLVLAYVVASDFSISSLRRKLSVPMAVAVTVLLSIAALQIDGYVGPSIASLKSSYVATGFGVHDALVSAHSRSLVAEEMLLAAQEAQSIRGGDNAEQWWYVVPTSSRNDDSPISVDSHGFPKSTYTNFGLAGEWFVILAGEPTLNEYTQSGSVIGAQFSKVGSPWTAARIVIRDFPLSTRDNVYLVVPRWLKDDILIEDRSWKKHGHLIVIPYVSRRDKSWPL
jgi:hypothetical protein